jgi:hypothetical protein
MPRKMVAAQARLRIDHLREHVVGRVERDFHALHRRGRDRGGKIGAIQGAGRGVELDVAQRAADRVVLLPAHELVQRHHDGAAPPGVGGVDAASLRSGAFVLEHQLVLEFLQSQRDPMDFAIARPAALDVSAVAPDAVGQQRELFQEGALAVVEDLAHHAFDGLCSISSY